VATATLWTGPDAPRRFDAPAVSVPADVRAWTAAMAPADRLDLHGRVESQALLGDQVIDDQRRGGWSRVVLPGQPSSKDPRGYPGWLPSVQLAEWEAPDAATATVILPTTTLLRSPGGDPAVDDVSFGTRLPVAGTAEGGWLPVHAPGLARPGWLPDFAVVVEPVEPSGPPPATELLAAAVRFCGLPYLWAGTCGLGLDCSGLVHLLFRRYGVTVPRDAHDQAAAAPVQVDPGRAEPGDLLFFSRPGQQIHHVGVCAGDDRMLHAPESGRGIVLEPLSPQRRGHLVGAGRWR
jgi:cell wall-associated NlpC family hydrolase